jgi:hypothetical protein
LHKDGALLQTDGVKLSIDSSDELNNASMNVCGLSKTWSGYIGPSRVYMMNHPKASCQRSVVIVPFVNF